MNYIRKIGHCPEPGEITKLNLLFEGSDFRAWADNIFTVLRYHHYAFKLLPGDDIQCTPLESANAATVIRSHTSLGLLARVPAEHLENADELFKCLKRLARHFRLMDLPPEIRERVFNFALPTFHCLASDLGHRTLPGLLHTSAQVRRETSPLFYSHAALIVDLPFDGTTDHIVKMVSDVEKWSSILAMDNLKCLQHIRVLGCRKLQRIDCTWIQGRGLEAKLTFNASVCDILTARIEKHINDTNRCAKALGLGGGQALLLFVIKDLTLWKSIWNILQRPGCGHDWSYISKVVATVRSDAY